ncbi:Serine/threonine-protein kinase PrkC [Planktothrix tepida]|uniref:non-specific serine/threonine protein kinase n=1 Tax=Planktothrix tepida PCC 9214 TaxID=671072 RepID=A0A1J1LRU2_9CYAN|nr:serine/threonine-protein kinase [Planktothrix tepida]CAD5958415.1 Serine/threonine-protein kinase PrkC [Planktothrix tepida]CUR34572.1 Protein kinase domain [Planktothrix tepida PCC 9214]
MTLHQPNDIIAQRYRIVTALGEGGMGITYEAEDLTNYQRVAVKSVSLRQSKDWKILELFEREAKVLAYLNHPGIPKYLDYFHLDTDEDREFYLIRELVSGESLNAWLEKGWHSTEAEIKQIAVEILEILIYLHQLNPPIIHRDIKPQNIIRQADRTVFLVDFGSVQDVYRNTMSVSGTFVGTIGYMPPEQLRGKAYPASDLYSLGGTLLYLLTHRSPDELPQKRMEINFRSTVNISPEFADWLERMLEPILEDRFQSANSALNALKNNSTIASSNASGIQVHHKKPKGSRVKIQKTSRSLVVDIPPRGFQSDDLFLWFFTIFWNVTLLFPALSNNIVILFSPFIIFVIIGAVLIYYLLWISFSKTLIKIDQKNFIVHKKLFFKNWISQGKITDLDQILIHDTGTRINSKPVINCVLYEGIIKHQFGSLLEEQEQEWLVAEISDFLQKIKGRKN